MTKPHTFSVKVSDSGTEMDIDGSPIIIGEAMWQIIKEHYTEHSHVNDAAMPILYVIVKAVELIEQQTSIQNN